MVLGGAKGGKIEQGKSHIYIKNNNIIEKVATVKQSGTVSSVRSDRTTFNFTITVCGQIDGNFMASIQVASQRVCL